MNKSMNRFQNDFAISFARIMEEKLQQWKEFQNEERKSLYSLGSIRTYLFVTLLAFVPGKREYNYDLKLHCWIAVVFFIFAVITNIQIANKTYQTKVKKTFFDDLLKVFGKHIFYQGYGSSSNISKYSNYVIQNTMFNSCQLYPRDIMTREDDDRFHGEYNGVKFVINETDFGWNENNKYRTYHQMFKGVAMHFKMNKEIKSRVLIMSKRFRNKVPKNYEKVDLEYNKFSKKYDVWVEKRVLGGSGQIEARYLLNTVFLDRFMQLQTSFRVSKVACSIYGNNMLVMLSTGRDLFEMNHLLSRIDDIKQYKHLFEEFASVLSFIEVLNLASKTKL